MPGRFCSTSNLLIFMKHVLGVNTHIKWMSHSRIFQIVAFQINLIAELLQFFELDILLIKRNPQLFWFVTILHRYLSSHSTEPYQLAGHEQYKLEDCEWSLTGNQDVLRKMTRSMNNSKGLRLLIRVAWLTSLALCPYSEMIFGLASLLLLCHCSNKEGSTLKNEQLPTLKYYLVCLSLPTKWWQMWSNVCLNPMALASVLLEY